MLVDLMADQPWWLFKAKSSYFINVFINLFAQRGCDTRSNFKRFLTGFNTKFSFSQAGCPTKVKDSSLSYYLLEGV